MLHIRRIDTPIRLKQIIPEQTHSFGYNRLNHAKQTYSFVEQTHSFGQNRLSPNRHIRSARMGATVPKRHIFCRTDTFVSTFNVGLKSFHIFWSYLAFVLGQLSIWISHSFRNGIEHINIPYSSPMEGKHIPTILHAFRASSP